MYSSGTGYSESNNDIRRREEMANYSRMMAAQVKEETPTMVHFSGELYHMPIEDDSYGYLTVAIRRKHTSHIQHRVRFKKQHKLGVIWTFGRHQKMALLSIEAALLPALEADAKANPPRYPTDGKDHISPARMCA